MTAAEHENLPEIIIEPTTGWASLRLHELWEYRELLYFFVWRELKVRYKQTMIGAAWALLQPLFTMLVFSLFFGRLAKIPSDGIPYPVFSIAGLVPWSFFANALSQSSNSLVASSHLVKKVYFPRLAIPISTVLAAVVDLLIALLLMFAVMLYYQVFPGPQILFLPLFLLLATVTVLGVGLWFSAMYVEYRDIRYVIPFLAQIWMYLTPIVYPSSIVPEKWRVLYALNPMVGVIEGIRWSVAGTRPPESAVLTSSIFAGVLLLVTGMYYFRRMEKNFADII
ncbi:MAG: ABC transporter permease [Bryobacterales bacterium]|nr:ABC transporter permease [Bryobacterales bacterium]